MHDMLHIDRDDWSGTLVALALLGVYWAWDNKWPLLLGGAAVGGAWLMR